MTSKQYKRVFETFITFSEYLNFKQRCFHEFAHDFFTTLYIYIPFFRKTQAKIQSFMDAQKTFFILGSLCQWKAEIFKSFGGSPMDLKGHCDWLQLACEIYNFFWIDLSEFILKGNLERIPFRT